MAYQFLATSVAGFVQQLAVGYITNSYYCYTTGVIPSHKDPARTDRKLLDAYDIELSRWTRSRRKKQRQASLQYLRCGRFYVLIATHGLHKFFEAEADALHDIRKRPILFMGYSIGCRRERGGGEYHASVRIQREVYQELKARFERVAVHRSVEELTRDLRALPFEPYAPVRTQYRCLLRAINRRRKLASLESIPVEALRLKRAPVRPYGPDALGDQSNSALRLPPRPKSDLFNGTFTKE
jgi:hypothetical protein